MKRSLMIFVVLISLFGCTKQSTKIAIDANREIERGNDEVFELLCYNYKTYLFNEFKNCKTPEDFDRVFKQREALETYVIQHERLRTYRMITVDRFLLDQQGILDLEWKKWSSWVKELKQSEPSEVGN